MARIGFLGTGEIAAAMVRTIADDAHEILVSNRSAAKAQALAQAHATVTVAPNQTVVADSDIVVLCLLADAARDVLPTLPFRPEQAVLSVMADVSLDELRGLVAPAADCSLTVPVLSMPVGGTPLAVFPASPAQLTVFADRVVFHDCANEDMLNAHLAATGALLPVLDLMSTVSGWLGELTDDTDAAERYFAALIQSYCAMIEPHEGQGIASFQAGLSTPGGLNLTLSRLLQSRDIAPTLRAGLDGLRDRLNHEFDT